MPTTSKKAFRPNPRRQLTDEQIALGNQMWASGSKYREIAAELGCSTAIAQAYCGEAKNVPQKGYGEIFNHRNEYLCLLSPETRASLDQHYNSKSK